MKKEVLLNENDRFESAAIENGGFAHMTVISGLRTPRETSETPECLNQNFGSVPGLLSFAGHQSMHSVRMDFVVFIGGSDLEQFDANPVRQIFRSTRHRQVKAAESGEHPKPRKLIKRHWRANDV